MTEYGPEAVQMLRFDIVRPVLQMGLGQRFYSPRQGIARRAKDGVAGVDRQECVRRPVEGMGEQMGGDRGGLGVGRGQITPLICGLGQTSQRFLRPVLHLQPQ